MDRKGVRDKTLLHAASSLYYSWCNLYDAQYSDQLVVSKISSIISDDIVLTNIDGTVKGIENFIQRVFILRKWSMAYHTRSIRLTKVEGDTVHVTAQALFQAVFPDFSCNEYEVNFHFIMELGTGKRKVRKIEVETTEYLKSNNFVKSYPTSRALGFVHQWLSVTSQAPLNEADLNPLLATPFEIAGDDELRINQAGELLAWVNSSCLAYKSPGKPPPNFMAMAQANGDLKVKLN